MQGQNPPKIHSSCRAVQSSKPFENARVELSIIVFFYIGHPLDNISEVAYLSAINSRLGRKGTLLVCLSDCVFVFNVRLSEQSLSLCYGDEEDFACQHICPGKSGCCEGCHLASQQGQVNAT